MSTSSASAFQGRDLYIRTTDAKGNVSRSRHRVWDAPRFMAARQSDAFRENAKEASTLARVEQITDDQFNCARSRA